MRVKSFSDFKTQNDVETTLGLSIELKDLTPEKEAEPVPPSNRLIEAIAGAAVWPAVSEFVLRETLISPVLTDIYWAYKDKLTIFSWAELQYEPQNDQKIAGEVALKGVCDYLVGGKPYMNRPKAPILCVVEAKKENFDTGTYQCAAELYAARLTNLRADLAYPFYFGAVSTGRDWTFIKLEGDILTRDKHFYSIENLPRLLGVWHWVLDRQIASFPQK